MVTIYFLSGLGSDERIFKNLKLKNCDLKFIQWIEPFSYESLPNYSKRLSEQIKCDNDIILVGLSFGGIVVQELAKLVNPKSVILLSSIKNEFEKPFYLKFLYYSKLHKILPYKLSKKITPLFYRSMGALTSEEQLLVKEFVQNTSITLLRWSVEQIVNWKQIDSYPKIYQIHGSKDKVFPINYMNPDYIIKEGTHFMAYNKPNEISEIILNLL